MRLPNTAHTSRPWRIHELTRDFRLEDVWALPTPGGPDDFPRLVEGIARGESDTIFAHRTVGPTADWACSSFQAAGDPHRFRTETMETTTTLLDEVLPECAVDVFSGWLRRDFLHRIARIAEGSA